MRRHALGPVIFSVLASALILVSSAQADTDLGQLGTNHGCGGSDDTKHG
jgi:hypothetical protein